MDPITSTCLPQSGVLPPSRSAKPNIAKQTNFLQQDALQIELRIPDVEDGAKLFLKHLHDPETPADASKIQEVVKSIGYLPLAVAQAVAGTGRSLDDMLALVKSERGINVGFDSANL